MRRSTGWKVTTFIVSTKRESCRSLSCAKLCPDRHSYSASLLIKEKNGIICGLQLFAGLQIGKTSCCVVYISIECLKVRS